VDARPRESTISGGDSNADDVGGCSIECDEPTRGTATAGEGGGIKGAAGVAANFAGEGVRDVDLERDLDLDLSLPSSVDPLTPLTTT